MQCKQCGAENSDNNKFCTKCGAVMGTEAVSEVKLVPSEVICSGCGKTIKAGIKFCNYCGMQQTEQAVRAQVEKVDTCEPGKQSIVANMLLKAKQGLATKNIKIGLMTVGVVAGVCVIGSCLIGSGDAITKDDVLLVCMDEDYERCIVTGSGKIHEIAGFSGHVLASQDLKHLYYLESDEEALYYLDVDKESQEIDDEVQSYTLSITPDGKSAIYLKDVESSAYDFDMCGTLMYWRDGKAIEVDDEVSYARISDNGAYIAYKAEDEIFLSHKGEEGKALDMEFVYGVANNGSVLGDDKDELVLQTTKEAQVLGEDLYQVVCSSDLTQIYFIDEDSDLYGYDGKAMQKIAEDVSYIEELYNRGGLFELGYVTEDEDTFIVKTLDKHYELKEDQLDMQYYYHPELKAIYYLEDGEDLRVATYGKDALEDERIAKDVTYMVLAPTRDKGVYLKDEALYAFGEGKEPKQIAEDIEDVKQLVVADAGYVWYIDTDDTLYYIDKKGEPKEIAEDVCEISSAIENSVYLRNDDGDVLKVTKDKVDENIIAEDMTSIYTIDVNNGGIY